MNYFIIGCIGSLILGVGFLLGMVHDISKRVQFIDEETSNTSLALIKLEDMAYKEREESAMPTRTKIADLVAENKQLKEELNASGHANYGLRTTNKQLEKELQLRIDEIDEINHMDAMSVKSKTTDSD